MKRKNLVWITLVLASLLFVTGVSVVLSSSLQAQNPTGHEVVTSEEIPLRIQLLHDRLDIPLDELMQMNDDEIRHLFEDPDNWDELGAEAIYILTDDGYIDLIKNQEK